MTAKPSIYLSVISTVFTGGGVQYVHSPSIYAACLHLVKDCTGELVGCVVAAHVTGADRSLSNNIIDSLRDAVSMLIEAQVSQQHGSREQHGSWVSLILALDIQTDVSASWLEDSNIATHVATRHDTRSANERSSDVGQDTTVQVRHDHDVELLWAGDALHGCIVDDHIIRLEGWEVFSDSVEGVAEEAIGQLHDVGLVDASDLLAVIGEGEGEGEFGNALGLGACDDLERLNDARNRLVLEAGVLALRVLTDDGEVDVLVAGLVTGDVLDKDDGCVDVELLAQGNVEGLVSGALDGRVQDALQANLVALQRGNGLAEELLGVLIAGLDARYIDLLPLDRHIVGFEDGLDGLGDLCSNAITGNERHCVF